MEEFGSDSVAMGSIRQWSPSDRLAVDCMRPLRKMSDAGGWIMAHEIGPLQEMVSAYLERVKRQHDERQEWGAVQRHAGRNQSKGANSIG